MLRVPTIGLLLCLLAVSYEVLASSIASFECTRSFFEKNSNSFQITGGCGSGIKAGFYPDLTRKNSYCECTGTKAPGKYTTCGPGLRWDSFSGGRQYLSGSANGKRLGKGGYYATNGGTCNFSSSLDDRSKQRPPYISTSRPTSRPAPTPTPSPTKVCKGKKEVETKLDFNQAILLENTLDKGGVLKYGGIGKVREKPVDLVISVAPGTTYETPKPEDNGKSGSFGTIELQNFKDKPNSGKGTFDFCFFDSSTNKPTMVDSIRWVFFDLDTRDDTDSGLGTKERLFIQPQDITDYVLFPNPEDTEIKIFCEGQGFGDNARQPPNCRSGERLEFRASTVGFLDDNPSNPNKLTNLQKKRSVSFTFENTSCFRVTFELYCPSRDIDKCRVNDDGKLGGGRFLFNGEAEDLIKEGECITPSPTTSSIPTNAPSDFPSIIPSSTPTKDVLERPSLSPSEPPSNFPSVIPSSNFPSDIPSQVPTKDVSERPSLSPSNTPSNYPSSNPSSSPVEGPDPTNGIIGNWELLGVGNHEKGKPNGKVLSISPFKGEMYFEANPSKLTDEGGPPLYGMVYANVPEGKECDEGTLLVSGSFIFENGDPFEAIPEPFDEYARLYNGPGPAFPQTHNGRIGKTVFSIGPDPFSLKGDQQIWFPRDNDESVGTLEMCVRTQLMVDFKGPSPDDPLDGVIDSVSFVDTKFHVDVSSVGNFSTFSSDIKIVPREISILKTQLEKTVPIRSFLCYENRTEVADEIEFIPGQDFRLCVQTEESIRERYAPESFTEIKCSNKASSRDIVKGGVPDPLTTIDERSNSRGVLSFSTTVTDAYLDLEEDSFDCRGKLKVVSIEKESQAKAQTRVTNMEVRRNLIFGVDLDVNEFKGRDSRHLRPVGSEETELSFVKNIRLSRNSTSGGSSAAVVLGKPMADRKSVV